jgi:hypothetical protein
MDANLPIVPEAIENVGASTNAYFKRNPWQIAGCIVLAAAAEWAIIMLTRNFGIINLAPFLIPIGWYSHIQKKIRHEFMQQFAAANGFQYSQKGTTQGLDGRIFQIGSDRTVIDVITGTFGAYPISLFNYQYTIREGKSSHTFSFTVFELQCDTAMPDLFLKQTDRMFSNIFESLASPGEDIKLEGDFNKYFTLKIAKGYEVEALEVFTPEVMAALIDKARSFSMEIVNNHLFIYASSEIGSKSDMYNMYALAQYFTTTLGPVLSRMKPTLQAEAQYLSK